MNFKTYTFGLMIIIPMFISFCGAPPKVKEHYAQHCAACHEIGAGGAPTRKTAYDWKIRRNQHPQDILRAVRKGFIGMPPSGRCLHCSDDELLAIIRFMRDGV